MLDLEGVYIVPGEEEKVRAALDALDKDVHAPREISVRYTLHIHREYPKHVTVGQDKDGNAITKIVNSEDEEDAAAAEAAAAAPAQNAAGPALVPEQWGEAPPQS